MSNTISTLPSTPEPAHVTSPPKPRWTRWATLWIIVLVLETILLANGAALDTFAWRSTRWFMGNQNSYQWSQYRDRQMEEIADETPEVSRNAIPFYIQKEPPLHANVYKRTEGIWRLLRDLGEPLFTVSLAILLCVYGRPWWRSAGLLIAATSFSGLVSTLVRSLLGRYRPVAPGMDGRSQFAWLRGLHDGTNLSWPSGHATLALATAAAFAYLSPRGRYYFLFVGIGCASARVIMQAHFWSDVIMGGAVGWSLGWMASHVYDCYVPGPRIRPDLHLLRV